MYGNLFRFQITYVDNPYTVYDTCICKVELFAKFRYRGCIHPSVVPWSAVHVYMVIQPQATFAFALVVTPFAPYISPVVVTKQQSDVVWNIEACVIISLNLRENSPKLWYVGCRLTVNIAYYASLAVYYLRQCLHVFRVVSCSHVVCHLR